VRRQLTPPEVRAWEAWGEESRWPEWFPDACKAVGRAPPCSLPADPEAYRARIAEEVRAELRALDRDLRRSILETTFAVEELADIRRRAT